jgi:hypothetical protein
MRELIFGAFRRGWPDYLLGTLAIGVVVAALLAQRAVSGSAESAVHDLAHRFGRNMIVLPAGLEPADFHRLRFNSASLPEEHVERIRKSPLAQHIRLVEPRLYGNLTVAGHDLVLVGTSDGWGASSAQEIPAALGSEAARRLSTKAGDVLQLNGVDVRIARIDDAPRDGLDEAIFVPIAAAQKILERKSAINALSLGGCWCRVDVPTLGRQVEELLPGTKALTVAGMLAAQKGTVATMKQYTGILLTVGIALVAAIVAALIASQVRRQQREVGLLLAVGFRPAHAALVFTGRAVFVGVAGALVGVALADPVTSVFASKLLGLPLDAPSGVLAPVLALSAAVAAFSGGLCALRAARLDPAHVLRET